MEVKIKNLTNDLLQISGQERENFLDYKSCNVFLRELMIKYGCMYEETWYYSNPNSYYYIANGIDTSKPNKEYSFLKEIDKLKYDDEKEKYASTTVTYFENLIEYALLFSNSDSTNDIINFSNAVIKIINVIFPIPYLSNLRTFQKNYQTDDYENVFDCKTFRSINYFLCVKQNLFITLFRTLLIIEEFDLAIEFFKKYKNIFNIDDLTFYKNFFSNTVRTKLEKRSESFRKFYCEKTNIKVYLSDNLDNTIDEEKYEEEYEGVNYDNTKVYFSYVVMKINANNLSFLHNLFEWSKIEKNDYFNYLSIILNNFEKANEISKEGSKDVEDKIKKFISDSKKCINQQNFDISLKELHKLIKGVTDNYLNENGWSKEMLYWLSILDTESRNQFIEKYLEMIENVIVERIENHSENNLNFEEKCAFAERFFLNANNVESDLSRKVNNYIRYGNFESIVSNTKCVDNIKDNRKLLNIIAGAESIFEQYEALDEITFNADYTNIIVAPIKAIERYLKEILVQKYNNELIPHIINNNYHSCQRYLSIRNGTRLSAELLSSNNQYNDSHIDIVNNRDEQLYRTINGNRVPEKFKPFELGTVCCSLRKIFNDANNLRTIFGYLGSNQNRDEAFLIQKLFIQKTRNGYFHIDTIDTYDEAKKVFLR